MKFGIFELIIIVIFIFICSVIIKKIRSMSPKARRNTIMISAIIALSFYLVNLGYKTYIENANQEALENDQPVSSEENTDNEKKEIIESVCTQCGKIFTGNGYGQNDNGKVVALKDPYIGSNCSFLCAKKAKNESEKAFDNISRKYGIDVNSKDKPTILESDGYHTGRDGRVYENKHCGLCGGDGLEEGKNINGDVERRICPMCDGRGVRSY